MCAGPRITADAGKSAICAGMLRFCRIRPRRGRPGTGRSCLVRALAEAFSCEAARLLGDERWARWGSEQVTSNFVIADEPDALLLPYDHYIYFWNEGVPSDVRFVHFIGSCRYLGNIYIDATR